HRHPASDFRAEPSRLSSPSSSSYHPPPRHPPPFPTRRSSDLLSMAAHDPGVGSVHMVRADESDMSQIRADRRIGVNTKGVDKRSDRKSTRLNSSHQIISYAVFCLKKKMSRAARRPPT